MKSYKNMSTYCKWYMVSHIIISSILIGIIPNLYRDSFDFWPLLFYYFGALGWNLILSIFIYSVLAFIIYIFFKRYWVFAVIASFISACWITLILINMWIVRVYSMPLRWYHVQQLFAPHGLSFYEITPLEIFFFILGVAIIGACFLVIAFSIKFLPRNRFFQWIFYCVILFGAVCSIFAVIVRMYGQYIGGGAYHQMQQLQYSMPLPFVYIHGAHLIMRHPFLQFAFTKEAQAKVMDQSFIELSYHKKQFNYPLHKLQYNKTPIKKYNIIFLYLDSWRYDSFNKHVMPFLYEESKKYGIVFEHYTSGWTGTTKGIFTLFYSMPPFYQDSNYVGDTSPVFFNVLRHYKYDIFMVTAAIFPAIKPLKINLHGAYDKMGWQEDQLALKDSETFIQQYLEGSKKNPFFLFLFFDAPHSLDIPPITPFKPYSTTQFRGKEFFTTKSMTQKMRNVYRNNVYFDDTLIAKFFKFLEQKHLLKNTIIVVSSDHGEELNDLNNGRWSHGSVFNQFQTHIPFILFWPGKKAPQKIIKRTSAYDVVPTILQEQFHIINPVTDYSFGQNVFTTQGWKYLLVGTDTFYAYIKDNQVFEYNRDWGRIRSYTYAGVKNNVFLSKEDIKNIRQGFKHFLKNVSN